MVLLRKIDLSFPQIQHDNPRRPPMAMDREGRIRQLAHDIWEREGHPHGRDAEHWRMATEAYEAEVARVRLDDSGEPIEEGIGAARERTMGTPSVASSDGAVASQPVASQTATTRKRRTKAEMEAARAAEAAAPPARRGRKPGGDAGPLAAETAPVVPKRKRRTKAEMAAAAAGVAGAAAAVAAATVAVSKRRRGAKAETVDEAAPAPAADAVLPRPRKPRSGRALSEAEPAPVAVVSGSAAGAVPDPSADGPSGMTIGALPDPGAARPSDPALKASLGSAPDARPSGERVAD
jgi:hypothetical protein